MPTRRFVVVVLPARDTRLGTLAADSGCQINLLARRAPGPAYDIAFEAKALPEELAREARDDLSTLAEFTYSTIDGAAQQWVAEARVPMDHVASRTYRALAQITLDSGAAWLVLDGGFAQVRLLPAAGVPADAFAEEVDRLLGSYALPLDIYTQDLDATWYDGAQDGLRQAIHA